ncbi:unnamed protein product [Symbiodinium natans]|uniref:Uncharacterized protein n=1 Tax=Symbiodinium natans TaxID=878477 RepID=A0A812MJN9_9DINO|nr:unnamed protein product [Symbiodinium natans]
MMAIPDGYVPVVAFGFCPPSGIFLQLGLYLFDIVNDLVQISTFLLHRDWWFAGVLSFFILLSLALTIPKMSEDSDLQRFDPLGEARLCLARGVPTVAWERMLACERNIEAPSTGLIGPYGASLLQLTPLQAASCLYGLCTSAKAMAEGRLHVEVVNGTDTGGPQALKAVRPVKATALFAWYFAAFTAELAAFAVASATLHPIITLPGYLLGAVANGVATWWSGSMDFLDTVALSCVMVAFAMAGDQAKSFLKNKATKTEASGPGFIPAIVLLIRFISWAALCFLDLPQGLVPLGSLGRPMGFPVLREKFLEPATVCWEALACFTSRFWIFVEPEANATSTSWTEEVGFGDCTWPTTGELSSASTIFNTCLLLFAVVLVPLHMCIVVGMLLFNPIYACGADNLNLKEEVEAKQREIDAFAARNEQAAGQPVKLGFLADQVTTTPCDVSPQGCRTT